MKKLSLLCSLLAVATIAGAQVYYSQDFEGTGIPTGWAQTTLANDGGWKFGVNTALQSQYFPIDPHTKMACSNDDACNCNKSADLLYTLSLDLTSSAPQVFMTYASFFFNLTYQGATETATIVASTDGGATWSNVATVPGNSGSSWQINSVDLSTYSGNPDVRIGFLYNDGGGWLYGWAIDDISVFSPPTGVDLSVTTIDIGKTDPRPAFVNMAKYLTGLPLDIRVTITNEASTPITSFDLTWSDGTNTNNQSVTGVNIGTLQKFVMTTTVPYTTLTGAQTVTVSASNVNSGATELNTNNNSGSANVLGVMAHPDAHYLAEEGTGTWCGWCPRGDVYMHYMMDNYPNQFVGIAVHNGDPMTVSAYDGGLGISAFPGVKVNRAATKDPSELEADFIDRIVNAPPAVLSGTAVLNSATSLLTVDLTGMFSQALSGDYRLAAILKEDSVHVVGSGYNQVNYYANNAAGPMGGYESLPATISSSLMYYGFVGRDLMGGFAGQSGSLPSSISAGATHSYQFTTTVPGTFNQARLSVVGVLLNAGNGQVLQALEMPVVVTTGIHEVSSQTAVSVYPNPATHNLHVATVLQSAQPLSLTVTDALGRVFLSADEGLVPAGSRVFDLNVSSLPAGVYLLSVSTAEGTIIRKFTR